MTAKILCQLICIVTNQVISRHTVVCRAAQEADKPHREYINRKKVRFSYLCSSVIPYPIETKVTTDLPAR